jgi:hypothetical protein
MGKQLLEFGKKLTANKGIGHKIAQAEYLHSVGDENLNEIKMARILSDLLRESEIDDRHGNNCCGEHLSGGSLAT